MRPSRSATCLRPALLGAAASHLTMLVPEALLNRHLASVAARSAFALPSDANAGRVT